MLNRNFHSLFYIICGLLLLSNFSCTAEAFEECWKYENEPHVWEKMDSDTLGLIEDYKMSILERLGENPVDTTIFESYQLIYHSAHGFERSITFEKTRYRHKIRLKLNANSQEYEKRKNYEATISASDWNILEKMIYDFDFWTEQQIIVNDNVLDGYSVVFEGFRPKANLCSKRVNKIIVRGSPKYDKVGALCDYIMDYESALSFGISQSRN